MRKVTGLLFVATVIFLPPLALYHSSFQGLASGWKDGFTRFLIFTYMAFAIIILFALAYHITRIIRTRRSGKQR